MIMEAQNHHVRDGDTGSWKEQLREVAKRELLLREAQRKLREFESLSVPPHFAPVTNRPPYMQSAAPAESEIIKSVDIN